MSSPTLITSSHPGFFRNLAKSLHGNFLLSIFIRGSSAVVTLMVAVVLARLLGVEEYGRYMSLYSSAVILAVFALRGSDLLLIRELSAGTARRTSQRVTLMRWATKRVLTGMAVAGMAYIGWTFIGQTAGAGNERLIVALGGLIVIAFYVCSVLMSGAINGYGAPQRSQMLIPLTNNSVMLLLLGGLWIMHGQWLNGSVALWLQATGCAVACVFGWILLRRLSTKQISHDHVSVTMILAPDLEPMWSSAARAFFYMAVANVCVNRLDVVLVSAVAGNETAGIYSAGARLAQVAFLVSGAVTTVLYPKISPLWHQQDAAALRRLMVNALAFVAFAALAEVLVAVFFGSDFIKIFGKQYNSSADVFVLVVVAYALWTVAGPMYALLGMGGSEKLVAKLSWVVAAVNILAIFVLVPFYGANGAAGAMIAGNVVVFPLLAKALLTKIRDVAPLE